MKLCCFTVCLFIIENLAEGKPAVMNRVYNVRDWGAERAVDGIYDQNAHHGYCAHNYALDHSALGWWQVDLQATYRIDSVRIYNRIDCCSSK